MKITTIFFILACGLLLALGVWYLGGLGGSQGEEAPILGGDSDEHGCKASAGYQWCPSEQKCMRMWEEYCEEYKDQYRGTEIKSFEDCVAAGYPVMESYPRQCRTPEGKTYTEELAEVVDSGIGLANPAAAYCREKGLDYRIVEDEGGQRGECLTKEGAWVDEWALYRSMIDVAPTPKDSLADECKSAGGNWNECGSRCMLDNQGKGGVACTLQCESLCECGGTDGYKCPEGYSCQMPEEVADALGYCVPKISVAQAPQ